jgi:hypothetical protein
MRYGTDRFSLAFSLAPPISVRAQDGKAALHATHRRSQESVKVAFVWEAQRGEVPGNARNRIICSAELNRQINQSVDNCVRLVCFGWQFVQGTLNTMANQCCWNADVRRCGVLPLATAARTVAVDCSSDACSWLPMLNGAFQQVRPWDIMLSLTFL